MKILIITSSFDLTVDYFIEKFKNNAEFFRFNTDLFGDYLIEINELQGWRISCNNWEIQQSEIDAIYYRKPAFPDLSLYEPRFYKMMQKDIQILFQGIVETFKGRCLSRPSVLSLAENKVYQLGIAKEIGFKLPRTMITNSLEDAYSFYSTNQSIIKPLSTGKVYYENKIGVIQTNIINEKFKLEELNLTPSYFQEYISKDYEVRVTIINHHFFGVKIESTDKVDWRKSDYYNCYSKIILPKDIEVKCEKIMDKLNLNFGAFDFIVNNGEYYFLEINPNGQWYWLEEKLELNISNCIYDFLAGSEQ